MSVNLILGDCLQIMPTLPANSVDSIVCDPPYMLNFMGKAFDRVKDNPAASVEVWAEALRVAKPGSFLLAFGGTRTHHRLMCAIEDAGWEIRDVCMWLYGSGFPKSASVSKLIDKAAGVEREVIGQGTGRTGNAVKNHLDVHGDDAYEWPGEFHITAPATDAARQWDGWGTALKPAWEPIIMARKPLSEPTIAANVLAWGTGGINVDGCRVGAEAGLQRPQRNGKGVTGGWAGYVQEPGMYGTPDGQGRWPANLILSEEAAELLDEMSGERVSRWGGAKRTSVPGDIYGNGNGLPAHTGDYAADRGGASRFFYVAKASKRDRDEGLEGMPERIGVKQFNEGMEGKLRSDGTVIKEAATFRNFHPTVKPTALMRWLVRLVTPPNGTVLDPFAGSGSTLKAAILEGFNGIGIELESEYLEIARKRIEHAERTKAQEQPMLLAAGD